MKNKLIKILGILLWLAVPVTLFAAQPFNSAQLAPTPSNGNCLTTNGSINAWSSSCGSGGGSGTSTNYWSFLGSNLFPATTSSFVTASYFVASSSLATSTFAGNLFISKNATTTLSQYIGSNLVVGNNIGIGTSTPAQALDVNGNIQIPNSTSTAGVISGVIYQNGNSFIHSYGTLNTFLGNGAGNFTMSSAAHQNVGIGTNALASLSSGSVGGQGSFNFGLGSSALGGLTTGESNIAIGNEAGGSLTTDSYNTVIGDATMLSVTGSSNVGIGRGTLRGLSPSNINNSTCIGTIACNNTDGGSQIGGLTNIIAIGYLAQVGESNAATIGSTGSNAVRVGIGSSSPSSVLTVQGSTNNVTSPLLSIASSTGTLLFTVLNTGNVGIGTTTPATALSVIGTTTADCFALNSSPTSCISGSGGSGTVTSVAMTTPTGLSVSGSPITTSGTLGLTLTAGYTIPLTASTTQWQSAYSSTTALNATLPIVYNGSTGNLSCPSCISSTTPLIATAYLWVDGNRNALTYTANGSIQYPYQTIDAAIAAINTSGVPNATLEIVASSSPYVENNLTMPNIPMTIDAQNSTILTGFGGGTGTITFPNTFVWNGGTILGNVNETDISTSTPHTFQSDAVILGNLTCSGLCTLLNGATQPNGITGATTTIYQNKGSLMNILGENVVSNIIDAGGTLNLNDDQVIANTSNYAVVATTTGSSVEVLGLTLVNTGRGGGFNVQNGATTVPNNLNNIIISENTGAIPVINNATTSTILSGYNAYSFTGTQQYAQGSGYIAPDNIGLQSDGTNNLGQNQGGIALGTTTIWNPLVASSTVTLTSIATSSFLATNATGQVIATTSPTGGSGVTTITAGTGITLSSGSTCTSTCTINSTGGSQWTGTSGGPIYYASPVSIGTSSYLYGLTIATDTDIDNGLFHASTTNNTITINTLQEGAPVFQTDSGVVSALDEPVDASATVGTLESYSFNNGGTPVLTIYGLSNGAGSTSNLGGGFGTTTPGQTFVDNGGFQLASASSTVITPSISGAIVGLGCDSATSSVDASISSSTTAFITTPQNYPGAGLTWQTYLSAPGVITTTVCSDVTVTPSASQYVVKIIR